MTVAVQPVKEGDLFSNLLVTTTNLQEGLTADSVHQNIMKDGNRGTMGRSSHAANSSALSFGANSGSNFRVDAGMNFNIAVNLSNTAGFDDTALIDVTSASGDRC